MQLSAWSEFGNGRLHFRRCVGFQPGTSYAGLTSQQPCGTTTARLVTVVRHRRGFGMALPNDDLKAVPKWFLNLIGALDTLNSWYFSLVLSVWLLWARSAMNHAEPMLNSRTMPRGYGSKNEEPNLANAPPTDGLRRGADPLGDIWSRLVHQLPEQ